MQKISRGLFGLLLFAASVGLAEDTAPAAEEALDELVLERTEITGNRELPKVMYIVPWQKSDPGALVGKPVNTLLDEVLAPLDRSEFIRQVDYYSDLFNDSTIEPPAKPAEQNVSPQKNIIPQKNDIPLISGNPVKKEQ